VAHAIATQLQSMGQEVAILALLDSYPLGCENARSPHDPVERDKEVLFAGAADVSIRNMLDILRREGQAFSSLKDDYYDVIKNTFKNNVRLTTTFLPKRFDGDILLFVAKEGEAKPHHEIWSPYVSGQMKVHWIECAHDAMMDTLPAAKIGSVLASELNKQ
jgi:nonribosomal peptide synthetase DhbF